MTVIDGNAGEPWDTIDGDSNPGPWTRQSDLEARWRPLTAAQAARWDAIDGMVERAIVRRWPDVQARLDNQTLDLEDVRDVVSALARQLLEVDPDIPLHAKSWQQTSGTESVSITLDGPLSGVALAFDDWMVDALDSPDEAAVTAQDRSPLFSAPEPDHRLGRALEDDYDTRGWGWY